MLAVSAHIHGRDDTGFVGSVSIICIFGSVGAQCSSRTMTNGISGRSTTNLCCNAIIVEKFEEFHSEHERKIAILLRYWTGFPSILDSNDRFLEDFSRNTINFQHPELNRGRTSGGTNVQDVVYCYATVYSVVSVPLTRDVRYRLFLLSIVFQHLSITFQEKIPIFIIF